MLEAIEKEYEKYNLKICKLDDMDDLIEATKELTESISKKFFIHDKYRKVNRFIDEIFKLVDTLITLLKNLEYGMHNYDIQLDFNRLYQNYNKTMIKMVEYLYKSDDDELKSLSILFDFNH